MGLSFLRIQLVKHESFFGVKIPVDAVLRREFLQGEYPAGTRREDLKRTITTRACARVAQVYRGTRLYGAFRRVGIDVEIAKELGY